MTYTAQHSTAHHSTAQHSTAQHSTVQRRAEQRSAAQRNATQRNATQRNATQHNTIQYNTGTNGIRAGWKSWREMSGVICDKKVPDVLKYKIYKTAIRPAMTYGAECWAIRKCDQNQMNTTEMKMPSRIQGKTRKDHISVQGEGGDGEDLCREHWTTLNRLRTGVGCYRSSLKKWGLAVMCCSALCSM